MIDNLEKTTIQKLDSFIGYGNPSGKYWFLGLEEGTHEDTLPLRENVAIRAEQFEDLMDLRTAQRLLQHPLEERRQFSQVWIWMSKIIRNLEGKSDWSDTSSAREYVKSKLGTLQGQSLITELLPYPVRNMHDPWPYATYFGTREKVIPERIELLRALIHKHSPTFIFAYGKVHHAFYKQLFPQGRLWEKIELSHRVSVELYPYGKTLCILTPFFGQGAIGRTEIEALCLLLSSR